MDIWKLPTSLLVNGVDWHIRTDFRAILDIIKIFDDPDYEIDEKWIVALTILYEDFEKMNADDYPEACKKLVEFIDMGQNADDKSKNMPKLMDWEQDAGLIIPAVNKALGTEIRALDYLHWWTFLGGYQEIGEGTFTNVINIRNKKAKGKKLEEYEKEYYKENKKLVDLKPKLTEDEQKRKDALNNLLG